MFCQLATKYVSQKHWCGVVRCDVRLCKLDAEERRKSRRIWNATDFENTMEWLYGSPKRQKNDYVLETAGAEKKPICADKAMEIVLLRTHPEKKMEIVLRKSLLEAQFQEHSNLMYNSLSTI